MYLENFPQKHQFILFGSKKSHPVGSKNTQVKSGLAPYLQRAGLGERMNVKTL